MADNVVTLPQRGKTYLTGPNRTADSTATTSKAVMGLVKVFKDLDYSGTAPVKLPRSQNEVTAILVRNSSGISLLPKMAVVWKSGARGKEVDGYTTARPSAAIAGIVDEFLPSTGVANNDYFWLVVKGPCMCKTAVPGDEHNSIGMDVWLVNVTAQHSTFSTTAGRVGPQILPTSGETTNITFAASEKAHRLGRAMSAKTTGNTDANILVFVDLY